LESVSAVLRTRLRAIGLSALWCKLCASAGITVQADQPVKALKQLYRIACEFQGEAWELNNEEEVNTFIEAGKLAGLAELPGIGPGIRLSFCFTPEERALLEIFVKALLKGHPLPEDDDFTARTHIQMQLNLKPVERPNVAVIDVFEVIDGTAFLEVHWEDRQLQIGVSVWLANDIDEDDPELDLHGFIHVDRLIRTLQRQRFRCFGVNHCCKNPWQGMLINAGDGGHIGAWFEYKAVAGQPVALPSEISTFLESLSSGKPVQCLLVPRGMKRQRACLSQRRRRQPTRQT